MATLIEDILSGIRNYLVAGLNTVADNEAIQAFPDDRLYDDPERAISKVSFQIYDYAYDRDNRFSGYTHDITTDLEAEPVALAILKRIPLPFRLFVQVDTFCSKSESRQIMVESMALFASEKAIATPDGRTYYPHIEPGDNQDDLLEGESHKVHRFSIPVWVDDPHAIEQLACVLQVKFEINGEEIVIQGS